MHIKIYSLPSAKVLEMFRLVLLLIYSGMIVPLQSTVIECETDDNYDCKLPFDFGGKTFYSCMLWHRNGEKASACLPYLNQTKRTYSRTSDLKYCSKGCSVEDPVCEECIFPFLYNGKIHNRCLKWHKDANAFPTWCATAVDLNNEFKNGDRHWGHCSDDCKYNTDKIEPEIRTVCKECVFPFFYNGKTYSTCLNSTISGRKNLTWCPIAVDKNNHFKDGDRHFAYCTPECGTSGNTATAIGLSFFGIVLGLAGVMIALLWYWKKCRIRRNMETGQFEFSRM